MDDGKSTLIGRLLYDTKALSEDQLEALDRDSKRHGTQGENLDFALLLDGLEAERSQGITIDVAYRYFSTAKRKFIMADTPGHVQYTRNMVTGASNADVGLILLDARNGLLPQTRRHAYLLSLLGIRHVLVVVNKMDLVDYDPHLFAEIQADMQAFTQNLGFETLYFIPISALRGDNIVASSAKTPWYAGEALLPYLENLTLSPHEERAFRFPVQYVNRPDLDFRGYAGTVASGAVSVGEEIIALPSRKKSRIRAIWQGFEMVDRAEAGEAVTLVLEEELDISRGDVLAHPAFLPAVSQRFRADLVWMDSAALQAHQSYLFKFTHETLEGRFSQLLHEIDIHSLKEKPSGEIGLNHIFRADITLHQKTALDVFRAYPVTGSFIVLDRHSNQTVAAGTLLEVLELAPDRPAYTDFELALNALIRQHFPHWEAKDLFKD